MNATTERIERIAERFGNGCPLSNYAFRGILKAALTAFAAEQEKWMPIETAPKDGTRVLLLIDGGAIVGYWGSIDWPRGTGIEVPNSEMWRMMWENYGIGDPSHWQPLPPAPSTGEKPE